MELTLKPVTKYPAIDGTEFATRKEAVAHSQKIVREQRIGEAMNDGSLNGSMLQKDEHSSNFSVSKGDLAKFIAVNGEKLQALLHVPAATGPRGPRKPKVAAETATVSA